MFELLIFDLDGTLVDSRRDIATAVNISLDELGMPNREPELIFGFIGGGVHNLIRKSLPEGREDLLDKGVDIFWENYREHVLDTTTLYPGVYKLLEKLSGRKLALVTNKPYAHTHMILQGLDIDRYFVSVQGWKMGLNVKPDPQLLNMALDEAGTPPSRAVMIGDSMADLLSARAAGVRSCIVGYGYGAREKLIEAAPDFFVESVSEIESILDRDTT